MQTKHIYKILESLKIKHFIKKQYIIIHIIIVSMSVDLSIFYFIMFQCNLCRYIFYNYLSLLF